MTEPKWLQEVEARANARCCFPLGDYTPQGCEFPKDCQVLLAHVGELRALLEEALTCINTASSIVGCPACDRESTCTDGSIECLLERQEPPVVVDAAQEARRRSEHGRRKDCG